MKNVLGNLALSALSTGLSSKFFGNAPRSILNRRQNLNFGRSMTRTTRRRNVRRRRRRNGMEINKAEGGYKGITIPYKTQPIGINCYGRLVVTKIGDNWVYGIQMENENWAAYSDYNLAKALVESQEMIDRLKTTSQYKVLSVQIATFINRIPDAKDRLSRILLYVTTSKVKVQDPRIQSNVMRVNGSANGTKNFNFRLTNGNLGKDMMEWFSGEVMYPGDFFLHIEGEDKNFIADDSETTVILGTVKFTFKVLTRIQDHVRNAQAKKRIFTRIGKRVEGNVECEQDLSIEKEEFKKEMEKLLEKLKLLEIEEEDEKEKDEEERKKEDEKENES